MASSAARCRNGFAPMSELWATRSYDILAMDLVTVFYGLNPSVEAAERRGLIFLHHLMSNSGHRLLPPEFGRHFFRRRAYNLRRTGAS